MVTDEFRELWNGKKITLSVAEFIQSWFLAEASPESMEPDYKEHKKQELFGLGQKVLLFVANLLIILTGTL
jgi:hypothetical protein